MTQTMKKGFSLIELLVVVAIIGVLAAVGIVGYQKYIDSAKKNAAIANADNVFKALSAISTARSGGLSVSPDSCSTSASASWDTCKGEITASMKNPYGGNKIQNTACASPHIATEQGVIAIVGTPTMTAYNSSVNITVQACGSEVAGDVKTVSGF